MGAKKDGPEAECPDVDQKKCMIKLNDAMEIVEQDCALKADNEKATDKATKTLYCDEDNCNKLEDAKKAFEETNEKDVNGAGQASLAAASIAVGVIMAHVAL